MNKRTYRLTPTLTRTERTVGTADPTAIVEWRIDLPNSSISTLECFGDIRATHTLILDGRESFLPANTAKILHDALESRYQAALEREEMHHNRWVVGSEPDPRD